jgi:hypothetical protein
LLIGFCFCQTLSGYAKGVGLTFIHWLLVQLQLQKSGFHCRQGVTGVQEDWGFRSLIQSKPVGSEKICKKTPHGKSSSPASYHRREVDPPVYVRSNSLTGLLFIFTVQQVRPAGHTNKKSPVAFATGLESLSAPEAAGPLQTQRVLEFE